MYHGHMRYLFIIHTLVHTLIYTYTGESLKFALFSREGKKAEENVLPTSNDKCSAVSPVFQDHLWAMKTIKKKSKDIG